MSDNVIKTEFGYEITWTDTDQYCGKILVFERAGNKTHMHMHRNSTKSWFINSGTFRIRWIDTKDGKLYEHDVKEGSVFHVPPAMPCSLESNITQGSVTEVSNKNYRVDDYFILIPSHNIGGKDVS